MKKNVAVFGAAILLQFIDIKSAAFAEGAVEFRTVLLRNDGAVGGEYHLDLEMKITDGLSPRTLSSLTIDVNYASSLTGFDAENAGVASWGIDGAAQGYVTTQTNLGASAYRILVIDNNVGSAGPGAPAGFEVASAYVRIATLKWTIATTAGHSFWISDNTDAAAYFNNLYNNPVGEAAEWAVTNVDAIVGDPTVNLALNKPATASSTDGSNAASRAVDGDADTYWRSVSVSSSAPVAWLRIDLQSPQEVGRAIVKWRSSYYAKSYELQVSNDDASWQTVYTTSSGASGDQEFVFSQAVVRYLRLYLTQNNSSSYRINELEIYSGPLGPAPSAPTNLSAAAAGSSSIDLAWIDNSTDEQGFKIERRIDSGSFGQIATVGSDVSLFQDTGLDENTTYTYRVRAYNGNGDSNFSNETAATTETAAEDPNANLAFNKLAAASSSNSSYPPSNAIDGDTETYWRSGSVSSSAPAAWLRIDLQSSQEIGRAIIKWKSSYYAKSYDLQISNDDVNWSTLYSTTGGASGDQEFFFPQTTGRYVRFYFKANNSSTYRVSEAELYRGDNSPPPNPPGNLVAAATGSSTINLTWTDNASDEEGFKVERKSGSDTFNQVATVGNNVTAYSDNGLSGSTTYIYRVRAYRSGLLSEYSNEASATTSEPTEDPNVNLALGQGATASSTNGSNAASRAVDGDTDTYWRSGSVSSSVPIAWLRVDLGLGRVIGRAVIRWKSSYYARSYELQVSNDDANWSTVYSTSSGASGTSEFVFAPNSARYVRLYMTKNKSSSYRISEFEIYFSAASLANSSPLKESMGSLPSEATLGHAQPNPFNPSTAIGYSLPRPMNITLRVYNVAGQEVAKLVDGYREEGHHTAIFQAGDLASGIYFSVLQAEGATQVRRLFLIK
jgi:hypothetical protein